MINIGDKLQDFTLPSTGEGGEFTLSAHAGRVVVLCFYPKDDTPGCTLENQDFSDLSPQFSTAGAIVFGVSRDPIRSHNRFREKHSYVHHLLADEDGEICRHFGVLGEKNFYGKTVIGVIRSTFIIAADGKLAFVWRDIKDVAGHAQAALASAQSLTAGGREES